MRSALSRFRNWPGVWKSLAGVFTLTASLLLYGMDIHSWWTGVTTEDIKTTERALKQEHQASRAMWLETLKVNRPELDQKYPGGYALLHEGEKREIIIPGRKTFKTKYRLHINWVPARIVDSTPSGMIFALPNYVSGGVRVHGNTVRLPKVAGRSFQWGLGEVRLYVEILVAKPDESIAVIGFTRKS